MIFLLIVNKSSAKEEFLIYHLSNSFYGSCYFDGKIIVFGESGDFIISEDMGKNWYRKHIFVDTVSIINLILQNGKLVGARKDGRIFTLDKYYRVIKDTLKFKEQEITSLNRLNDTIFSVTTSDYNLYFFNDNLTKYFESKFVPTNSEPFFKIVKGNLFDYVAVSNNRILFTTIYPYKSIPVKITDYNLGNKIYNLFRLNNEVFVDIDGKLMKINETTYMAEPVSKDSSGGIKIFKDNNIFNIRRCDDSKYNFATIEFSQLTNNYFEQRCVLNYDRLIYKDFEINNVNIIDENTIVAVGTKNTIFISYDRGFQWQIVSYFNPDFSVKWLNDNIGFYGSYYNQLFRTIDGGSTFLPQKRIDESPYSFSGSQYLFDINENGRLYRWSINHDKNVDESKMYNFIFSDNYGEDYEQKWIDGIFPRYSLNMFHPSSYNTIKFKNYNFHNLIDYNLNFTMFVRIEPNSLFNNQNDINVTHVDSAQLFLLNEINDKIWAYIAKGDSAWLSSSTDLELLKWNNEFCFNEFMTHHKISGIMSNIEFSSLTYNSFKSKFIISLKDTSFSINPVIDFSTGSIIKGDFKNYEIYSYFYIDLNNKTFKLIYKDTLDVEGVYSGNIFLKNVKVSYKPGFVKISYLLPFLLDNNQIYFRKYGNSFIRFDGGFSCDISNIAEQTWVPVFKEIQIASFEKYKSSSMTMPLYGYFQQISENKFIADFLVLEKGNAINKVEESEKKDVYMYKYLPYPQPGTNQIKVKIYTNNFDCFNPKTFEVYNSNGILVSVENDFGITQTCIFEAEISWNCSSAPSGVYFIKLNCETYNDVIKVIKN